MSITRVSIHFDVDDLEGSVNAVETACHAIAKGVGTVIERLSKVILEDIQIGTLFDDGEEIFHDI